MSKNAQQDSEVAWYLLNGKYPAERITLDGDGEPYLIGDHSWNNQHRIKTQYEMIEREMNAAIKNRVHLKDLGRS